MTIRLPTLAAIRRTCQDDDGEGAVRLLFLRDGGRIGLVQTAHETADNADQFLARYLAQMITDVGAPAAVVTITRGAGRPATTDRQLWSMLGAQLAATNTLLLDLVVLGADRAWSARRAGPLKPARRRQNAGRRSASPAAAR